MVSVCQFVPAWALSSKPAAVGLLLWARRAGDIDQLLQLVFAYPDISVNFMAAKNPDILK